MRIYTNCLSSTEKHGACTSLLKPLNAFCWFFNTFNLLEDRKNVTEPEEQNIFFWLSRNILMFPDRVRNQTPLQQIRTRERVTVIPHRAEQPLQLWTPRQLFC